MLDPDVVLRSDWGARGAAAPVVIRGAAAVARLPHVFSGPGAQVRPALVNGAAGAVVVVDGRPFAIMGFTVAHARIVEIDTITDPERVRTLAAAVLAR